MARRKEPPREKPKALTVHEVRLSRRFILVRYMLGDEEHRLRCPDNPLPTFTKAMDAMARVVQVACHLPADYVETGLRITGVKFGSQGESPTVSVLAQKSLDDASKALPIVTPPRLLAHPTKPGTYTPPLDPAEKELVENLIDAAKAYVRGERAQGQLKMEDDNEDGSHATEEANQTGVLPFAQDNGGTGKPARKRVQQPAAAK